MTYVCTECGQHWASFEAARACHYGIGGVMDEEAYHEAYPDLIQAQVFKCTVCGASVLGKVGSDPATVHCEEHDQ